MTELSAEQKKLLKEKELDLLQDFIRFCLSHHLRYWLIGGSLLGAVRHGGMIPWDDDIDVCMPRKDYDMLVKFRNELPGNRFLQCAETEPAACMLFAKLMDTGTVYRETSRKDMNIHHCVFIDIFPLDDWPDERRKQAVCMLDKLFVRLRQQRLYSDDHLRGHRIRRAAVRAAGIITEEMYPDAQKLCARYENRIRQSFSSERVCIYAGAYGRKDIYRREWFEQTLILPFEQMNAAAPAGYDDLLKQVYGDYMKYPPEHLRKGHHDASEFQALG